MAKEPRSVKECKPINVALGRRVQRHRLKANLSREKLADRVGISARFLADIEVGHVGVSVSTLTNLCVALSVSADALLFDAPAGIDALLQGLDERKVDQVRELVKLQLIIMEP